MRKAGGKGRPAEMLTKYTDRNIVWTGTLYEENTAETRHHRTGPGGFMGPCVSASQQHQRRPGHAGGRHRGERILGKGNATDEHSAPHEFLFKVFST